MEKRRLVELTLSSASLSVLMVALLGSFSYRVKNKIKEAAHHECQECSRNGRHKHSRFHALEASHKNHKRDRNYNNPENGELLCRPHHYVYHLMFRNNPGEIGLSYDDNEWAIDSIWERMTEKERKEAVRMMEFIVYKQVPMFQEAYAR